MVKTTEQIRDEALKRALFTPPKPHKAKAKKKRRTPKSAPSKSQVAKSGGRSRAGGT